MLKKWARKFHILLGLLVLVPLLIVSSSGIFLSYHQIGGAPADLNAFLLANGDTLRDQVSRKYPGEGLASLTLPRGEGSRIKLKLVGKSHEGVEIKPAEHFLFWDAKSAKGVRDIQTLEEKQKIGLPDTEDLAEWAIRLHRGSWAGTPGKIWMSASAALIVLLWVMGLVLHRIYHGRVYRKLSSKLHAKLGILAGALLVCMAISGGFLNFVGDLAKIFDPPQVSSVQSMSETTTEKAAVPFSKLLTTAFAAFPGQKGSLTQIRFAPTVVSFYFYDNTRIHLDAQTGTVKQISGPTVHWIYNLYPLHSGHLFGIFGTVLWILIGISVLILTFTGLSLAGFLKAPRPRSSATQ